MNETQRTHLEDAIFDAHFAAQKYIENDKDLYEKLIEVSVEDALDLLEDLSEDLKHDDKAEAYKLHLLVPLQLYKLIQMRKENGEEDTEA